MTTQSHTELAARARDYADRIDPFKRVGLDNLTCSSAADALRQCAAALESPERVQGDGEDVWLVRKADTDVFQHPAYGPVIFFTEDAALAPTPPTAPAQDAQREATGWKRCEACNGKGDSASGRTACGGCRGSGRVFATPSPQAEVDEGAIDDVIDKYIVEVANTKAVLNPMAFAKSVLALAGIVTKEST